MHDAEINAVEIDDLILLVIHLRGAMKEPGACWPQVGTAARRSVVTAACGRRPRMKVFRLSKVLPDQARSNDFAVRAHQTAVRLPWKDELRNAGHQHRINQSCKYGESEH